jgi:hypothetical protein
MSSHSQVVVNFGDQQPSDEARRREFPLVPLMGL